MQHPAFTLALSRLRKTSVGDALPSCVRIVDNTPQKVLLWPGTEDENICIRVHGVSDFETAFHRHDYFYFNFTYKGAYGTRNTPDAHESIIKEADLYAGQPFSGHCICALPDTDTTIIGIFIRKETFLHAFLPMLSPDMQLFHFFLDPSSNQFAEEHLHISVRDSAEVSALLEMLVIEYAAARPDTQQLLTPLALALLLQIARLQPPPMANMENPCDALLQYISSHYSSVTLQSLADEFSYHPNYVSALLHKSTGKTFSQLLLEQRMERAAVLLRDTALSTEQIAAILGYSNASSFHKAFRRYHHSPPGSIRG